MRLCVSPFTRSNDETPCADTSGFGALLFDEFVVIRSFALALANHGLSWLRHDSLDSCGTPRCSKARCCTVSSAQRGGQVQMAGGQVAIANANINADGDTQGGEVQVVATNAQSTNPFSDPFNPPSLPFVAALLCCCCFLKLLKTSGFQRLESSFKVLTSKLR